MQQANILALHPKRNTFYTKRNETRNTTLVMATAEKSHKMVTLLLKYGADANAINNDGRTALIEAALWG